MIMKFKGDNTFFLFLYLLTGLAFSGCNKDEDNSVIDLTGSWSYYSTKQGELEEGPIVLTFASKWQQYFYMDRKLWNVR